jgi:Kef-type K+ transport system membrane component KefB
MIKKRVYLRRKIQTYMRRKSLLVKINLFCDIFAIILMIVITLLFKNYNSSPNFVKFLLGITLCILISSIPYAQPGMLKSSNKKLNMLSVIILILGVIFIFKN